ncbi:MAG: gamma-glutamyltransferase [Planctomycetota bacterium]
MTEAISGQVRLGTAGAAIGTAAMVATAFPRASEAAIEILQAGGNAIDAAAAAAWALAVCEPSGSGLGGQTTLLIRFADGRASVIDGHSYAPAAVSKKLVSRSQQRKGYRACVIPSTPATLDYAQSRYGVLSREKVMGPAIRIAEDGYAITRLQRRQLNWCRKYLAGSEATNPGAPGFLKDGMAFRVGDIFRQKQLAGTLRRLACTGIQDFYQGQIARTIAQDMKEHGGLITKEDLAGFTLPVEREAISVSYRDYEVISAPAPAGGLQVLMGLKILEQLISGGSCPEQDEWIENLAEVSHAVFHQREALAVSPRDLSDASALELLSEEYAAQIAENIKTGYNQTAIGPDKEEPGETTHLCTADEQGNVVTLTQSIQSLFGAKVANGRLGFIYNNYLCTCTRRRHPYQLGGGCIPRSNAAPTVVLRNTCPDAGQPNDNSGREQKPFLALGAAGSRRITSSVLQVISNIIDRRMSLEEAVSSPRVHGLLSRKVSIEKPAATEAILKRLEKRFHNIRIRTRHSYSMGAVQALQFREEGTLIGVADPRRDGSAIGLNESSAGIMATD